MRIGFKGQLLDEPEIRVGFIGCGSHSFRNIYPTFQFAPVNLVATCDLDLAKAQAFAKKFGASAAYSDYHTMLQKEKLDAVFLVTGYDKEGRPNYPSLALDCLNAGCHVWMEKPPAATTAELETLQAAAARANKQVMVGLKKMFFPANEKAKELMSAPDFGTPSLLQLQYPQPVPTVDDLNRYLNGHERLNNVIGFLDHLCHPTSLLVYLAGMPQTLFYQCAPSGAASATFSFPSGLVATLLLTEGSSNNGGMERTYIVGEKGRHILVENNIHVSYHRSPHIPTYGADPTYFLSAPGAVTSVWDPEFSLGQLYNKGLFLLGYYGEVYEFTQALLQNRPLAKAHLTHALQVTRIFEAFAQGPNKLITL